MKKWIMAAIWSLSSTASANESAFITKMEWKVLGINTQNNIVAFKKIYAQENGEEGTIDCGYKGIPSGEFVQLGAWSLTDQKVIQTWDVYPSVTDEANCASEDTSKKTLQAAKDYFVAQNIDISKSPSFVSPSKDGKFRVLAKENTEYVFVVEAATETNPVSDEDSEVDPSYTYKRDIKNVQSKVVYHFEQEGTRMMASTMSVEFERAYVIGNKVVFLQKFASSSMRHSDIQYSFTPMITLE